MSIDIEQEALEAIADAWLGTDDPPEAFVLGYKAGAYRVFTKEEIEAAAHKLYEFTHAPEADPGWYVISEYKRKSYRDEAGQMLIAARKAVTE